EHLRRPHAHRPPCHSSREWLRSFLTSQRIPYHFGAVALSAVYNRPHDQFRVGDKPQIDLSVRPWRLLRGLIIHGLWRGNTAPNDDDVARAHFTVPTECNTLIDAECFCR